MKCNILLLRPLLLNAAGTSGRQVYILRVQSSVTWCGHVLGLGLVERAHQEKKNYSHFSRMRRHTKSHVLAAASGSNGYVFIRRRFAVMTNVSLLPFLYLYFTFLVSFSPPSLSLRFCFSCFFFLFFSDVDGHSPYVCRLYTFLFFFLYSCIGRKGITRFRKSFTRAF